MGFLGLEIKPVDVVLFVFSAVYVIAILVSIWVSATKYLSKFITESGSVLIISLIVGAAVKLIAMASKMTAIEGSASIFAEVFYSAFLPVIIFNAGFTMRKKNFFKYTIHILVLAIFATLIACVFYGVVMWGFTNAKAVDGSNNLIENLLHGSVVAATDTVAIITLFTELNVNSQLYSLVFGESVLNDAVAIVLFRTLKIYVGGDVTFSLVGKVCLSFLLIFCGSIAIGLLVGLFSAFVMRKLKSYHLSVTWEFSLMLIFAYASYTLAEMIEMSGIFSVFICSVIMAHYNWYSIAPLTRSSLFVTSGTLAYICETGCFIGLGVTLFNREDAFKDTWNFTYILFSLIWTLVARAVGIVPLMLLLNIKRTEKVSWRHIFMQWWAGLRGAVAIILALTEGNPLFVNSVYVIVLVTNLIMGGVTKPIMSLLKIEVGQHGESINSRNIEDDDIETSSEHKNWIWKQWSHLDELYFKPMFGGKTAKPLLSDTGEAEMDEISQKDSDEELQKEYEKDLEEAFVDEKAISEETSLDEKGKSSRRSRRTQLLGATTQSFHSQERSSEKSEQRKKKATQLRRSRVSKKRRADGSVFRTVSTSRDIAFGIDEDDFLDGYE